MRKYNATLFNTRGRLYYSQIIYIISLQFYGSEYKKILWKNCHFIFSEKNYSPAVRIWNTTGSKEYFFFSSKEITWSTNTKTKFMMRQVTALWRKVRQPYWNKWTGWHYERVTWAWIWLEFGRVTWVWIWLEFGSPMQ